MSEHWIDTHRDIAVNAHRRHLVMAKGIRSECNGCGQPIPFGNIGVATWCDHHQCNIGGWSFQHGCGTWNSPVEVDVKLDDDWDDMSETEQIAALDALHAELMTAVAEGRQAMRDKVTQKLQVMVNAAALEVRALGLDPNNMPSDEELTAEQSDALDALRTDFEDPGVTWQSGGALLAWDYDPISPEDPIEVFAS